MEMFPKPIQELRVWFENNGGFLNPAIEIREDSKNGVHMRAVKDLSPEEIACTTPLGLTLSHLNLLDTPPSGVPSYAKGSICSKLLNQLPHNDVAAFFLAEQTLKGPSSFWAPYINTLPRKEDLCTPLWFKEEDLVWLCGTNLYTTGVAPEETAIGLRKEMIRSAWETGRAIIEKDEPLPEGFNWELFLWASTIFSSRCFPSKIVMPTAEDFPLLFPVKDAFNHSFGAKVSWDVNRIGALSLQIHEAATQGSQIFNNYAPKSNEEFLLGYGFTLTPNPSDTHALRLSRPPPPIHAALRTRLPTRYRSPDWATAAPEESLFYILGRGHHSQGYDHSYLLQVEEEEEREERKERAAPSIPSKAAPPLEVSTHPISSPDNTATHGHKVVNGSNAWPGEEHTQFLTALSTSLRGIPPALYISLQTILGLTYPDLLTLDDRGRELAIATVSTLLGRVRAKEDAIRAWDEKLPRGCGLGGLGESDGAVGTPRNRRQEMAKGYRDGQRTILAEVGAELEAFLEVWGGEDEDVEQ